MLTLEPKRQAAHRALDVQRGDAARVVSATPIDRWLFGEFQTTPADMRACRVLFAVAALVLFWGRGLWAVTMPAEFWQPPVGPAKFFGPPGYAVVLALNVALAVSLTVLLMGRMVAWASLAAGLLMLLLNTITYSFGKIDHDILMVLTPLFLAFCWGGKPRPWCLALLAVCIAIGMFTAGWSKLLGGWLDPSHSAVRNISAGYIHGHGWQGIAGLASLQMPGWLLEAQDWATVALELGFPLALIRRQWFQWACITACAFHVGILLTLDLAHPYNLLAYAAFFPLAAAAQRAHWWLPLSAGVVLLVCPWHGWQEFAGQLIVGLGAVLATAWALQARWSNWPARHSAAAPPQR